MISARIFILIMSIGSLLYGIIISGISDKHRKKPLPEEVSDVYNPERYQTYINFEADKKKLRNKYKAINLILDIVLIFSPVYEYIDNWFNGNPYLIFLTTYMIIWVISTIIETFASYEITFGLMEKYGLNKKDLKEFVKDEVINELMGLFITVALLELLTFIGEHMSEWTNGFSVGYKVSFLICLGIVAVLFIFFVVAQLIGYAVLKKQYTFTPLKDGELKDKINALQADSKKKVKRIYIYNESKKTTTKNAFLLKLFWHREFGIADNFINENAEDELLAVLSHEIGHLKHKKNILNFISYGEDVLLAIIVLLLMVNPEIILICTNWIRESFNITANNYYLIFIVFGYIIKPLSFLSGLFSMYKSRWEEYEADRESVKNGYGEALITTFKTLSSDELVNVYPHPFIEFTEYDHPGMYQRIKAIREAMK